MLYLGCHRVPPDSPEFQQAFGLYNQLYAARLDDAYGDPQMQTVLSLLQQVDPASAQAGEARDLKAKVEQGMADFKKRQEKVAEDEKAAEAPPVWPSQGGDTEAAQPPSPGGAAGPALGMTREAFLARFGDCFQGKGIYRQGPKEGEAYGLKASCRARYPALDGNLVVLLDGKVERMMSLADVNVSTETVHAGLPPAAAPPSPHPSAAPQPPPTPVHWLPGAPHPATP